MDLPICIAERHMFIRSTALVGWNRLIQMMLVFFELNVLGRSCLVEVIFLNLWLKFMSLALCLICEWTLMLLKSFYNLTSHSILHIFTFLLSSKISKIGTFSSNKKILTYFLRLIILFNSGKFATNFHTFF